MKQWTELARFAVILMLLQSSEQNTEVNSAMSKCPNFFGPLQVGALIMDTMKAKQSKPCTRL